MADKFATGATWMAKKLKAHGSKSVTYHRGASQVSLSVTTGQTRLRLTDDLGNTRIKITDRDFIFTAADLDFGSGVVLPAKGDLVKETVGGDVHVFEVNNEPGEKFFRWVDTARVMIRVHTKRTGTE